jgi:hypothetical protein
MAVSFHYAHTTHSDDDSDRCECYAGNNKERSVTTKSKQAYFPHQTQLFGNSRVGRFVLHFLELQIPMVLGALICYLVVRLISGSSSFATTYRPGGTLFAIGDLLFLTVPVVIWMILRRYSLRHSFEMGIAMIAPVAGIMVLGQLTAYDYLTWLLTASYPLMCLGMLIYMLYWRDFFTRQAGNIAALDHR